jgi:uncharacterized membrane protein YphA (DoxX/SURF4 family)
MKMTVLAYPDGLLGAGLAVLRLSMAGATLTLTRLPDLGELGQWLLAGLCVSLVLGAGARWSALAGAVALAALGPHTIPLIGGLTALILAGPGAFSIDARVWGRVRVRSRSSR